MCFWNNPPEPSRLLCLVLTAKSKRDCFHSKINWKTHCSRAPFFFHVLQTGGSKLLELFSLHQCLPSTHTKKKVFKPMRTLIIFGMLYMKKKLICQSSALRFYSSFLCLPRRFFLVLITFPVLAFSLATVSCF